MTNNPWDAKFEDVLRSSLPALGPVSPLEPGVELAVYGLDPAGTAGLVDRLEETYCVVLPEAAVTSGATPETVWAVLRDAIDAVWSHELAAVVTASGSPARQLTSVVPEL